ncbi:unnamed protein product, partial [Mycena citricolor]
CLVRFRSLGTINDKHGPKTKSSLTSTELANKRTIPATPLRRGMLAASPTTIDASNMAPTELATPTTALLSFDRCAFTVGSQSNGTPLCKDRVSVLFKGLGGGLSNGSGLAQRTGISLPAAYSSEPSREQTVESVSAVSTNVASVSWRRGRNSSEPRRRLVRRPGFSSDVWAGAEAGPGVWGLRRFGRCFESQDSIGGPRDGEGQSTQASGTALIFKWDHRRSIASPDEGRRHPVVSARSHMVPENCGDDRNPVPMTQERSKGRKDWRTACRE